MKTSDMNSQAPVGTTLALLERNMKVMSAVQARLHASMKREFEILVNVIKDFTEPNYPYEVEEGQQIKVQDFDSRVDVLPVSDPNAATMAQRIMQYQAAMQLAQQAPQLYDLAQLHRQMLEVLGIKDVDTIVPPQEDVPAVDPVTAVQNIITGKPVQAYEFQDHEAHIQTLTSAQQDPSIQAKVQQSPNAQVIQSAGSDYIMQHLALQFRDQVEREMGIELPPVGEPLPADVEKRISTLVAEAAKRVASTNAAQAEQARIQEQAQDPIILAKQKELEIKETQVRNKQQIDESKIMIDAARLKTNKELEEARIKAQQEATGLNVGQRIASDLLSKEADKEKQSTQDYKLGLDIAKDLVKDINLNE
tara:strand:- start:971 stop:2062 length:1092 start_codon:yes stop_codon:yes gene_type:complete